MIYYKYFVVVTTACAAITNMAQAASKTWDSDSGTTGAQDGSGIWNTDTSNTNWWDGAANRAWSSGDDASIGAGSSAAGTITLLHQDGGTGTLNLNAGGRLKAKRIFNQAGSAGFNVNFNGGLLVTDANVFQPSNTHNEYADFKLLAGGLTLEIPSGKNSTLIRPFQQNGPLTKTGVGTLTMAGSDSENVMTVQGGSVNLHAGLHEIVSAGGKSVGNCVPTVAPIVLDGGNLGVIGRANAGAIGPRTFTYNATGVNTNHKILRGGNTSGLVVGMGITGANIPPGAFITHILDGANLRMSVNATGGATGTTALSFDAVDTGTRARRCAGRVFAESFPHETECHSSDNRGLQALVQRDETA